MKTTATETQLPLPMKIAAAGLAGCTADLATFPLDTIKVWLQVRGEAGNASGARCVTGGATAPPTGDLKRSMPISSKNIAKKHAPLPANNLKRLSPLLTKLSTAKSRGSPVTSKSGMKTSAAFNNKAFTSTPATKIYDSVSSASKVRSTATVALNDAMFSGIYAKERIKATLSENSKGAKKGSPALQAIVTNLKQKGVRSLYSGLNAGLQRQIGFCSVRIGCYDTVKNFYCRLMPGSPDSSMLGQRILAGATTGIMAVCLFQPTEVAKIQMQAKSGRYKGTLHAYRHLYKTGGISEMWKGIGANCTRTAVVNVCELVTYDMVKETILKRQLMEDRLPCHFASALISGFITTVVASPVDVVKTRYMNSAKGTYTNPLQCATQMFQSEGFKSFCKGFVPSYLRLGAWNIVMFVSFEQYKRLFRSINSEKRDVPLPAQKLLSTVPTPTIDPAYPAYVAAIFHSIHEAGPIS